MQNKNKKYLEIDSLEKMYGESDLSKCALFSGGFINFGYWDIFKKSGIISEKERIESEKNLYRFLLKKIGISKKDRVLEVACGLGFGSALLLSKFSPKEIKAIDISPSQIERAKKMNQEILTKSKNLEFKIGNAENIPFDENSFEKVFSVEAAQHFLSIEAFINETYRVLKSGGKVAITTFFGKKSEKIVAQMIETIKHKIDRLFPIADVRKMLENSGFKKIRIESIGKNVWFGYDKWISQSEFVNTWNSNWYKAYKLNLLDYYIITAEKTE